MILIFFGIRVCVFDSYYWCFDALKYVMLSKISSSLIRRRLMLHILEW